MTLFNGLRKDHLGAGLLVALGIGILSVGFTYRIGTPGHMGAGFMPVVLGVLMTVVGLAIGITANQGNDESSRGDAHAAPGTAPEWRGWVCILGGVTSFVVLGQYGGLVPASFAAVFIAALGDRQSTLRSAATLAAVIDLFGVLVFHFGLSLQLPLFQWG